MAVHQPDPVKYMAFEEKSAPWDSSSDARTVRARMERNIVLQQPALNFGKSESTGNFHVSIETAIRFSELLKMRKLGGIPYFFSRSATSRDLFNLITELRPALTSAGIAEHIRRMLPCQIYLPG